MSSALAIVGGLLAVIGCLMILAAAFRTSTGWGLSSLLIPGAVLFFVFTNWPEAKRGFFTILVAGALLCGAGFMKKQEEAASGPEQPSRSADQVRGTSQRPAAASPHAPPPPPPSSDSSPTQSPTIRWMGQAQGAGDAQRQSGSAEHSDAAATEQP